jgi:MFS family permease
MAFFGFTWGIPSTFGVIISGLIMDYIGPNSLWYFAAIIGLITAIGFWLIRKIAKDRLTGKIEHELTEDDLEPIEQRPELVEF